MKARFLLAVLLAAVSAGSLFSAPLDDARRFYSRTDYASAISMLKGSQDTASLQLLGQSYLMTGDSRRASEVLERALASGPPTSDLYMWLGRAYGRRAETAFPLAAPNLAVKARQNLERAVELNPNSSEAVEDLFEYYIQAPGFLGGGSEKAQKLVALIARRDAAEGAFAEARLAEERKQYESAEAHLRRAVSLAPKQGGRVLDLARFLARRGHYEESDQIFAKALAAQPNTPKIVFTRADVLVRTNRNLPEARELLKRYLAFNLTPDDPSREEAEKLLRKASGS